MQADLLVLLELQEKDRTIRQLQEELRAFDPELADLDNQLSEHEARLAAARRAIEEAGNRRMELEQKIENFRQMQERRRQRLEWVRGAKEASTLMAELDLGRSVLAKEESEWVRSADRVQEAELKAAEIEKEMREVTEGQVARRAELAALQGELRERIGKVEVERDEVTGRIAKPVLTSYERIRRGRAPLALYALHGGACGHCFTAVPMHRRQEIHNGNSIVTCEACGVLVYETETVSDS